MWKEYPWLSIITDKYENVLNESKNLRKYRKLKYPKLIRSPSAPIQLKYSQVSSLISVSLYSLCLQLWKYFDFSAFPSSFSAFVPSMILISYKFQLPKEHFYYCLMSNFMKMPSFVGTGWTASHIAMKRKCGREDWGGWSEAGSQEKGKNAT